MARGTRVVVLWLAGVGAGWALEPWSAGVVADRLERHAGPGGWVGMAGELRVQLEERHAANGADVFRVDRDFLRWMDVVRWLEMGAAMPSLLEDEKKRELFEKLAGSPEVIGPLLEVIRPEDDRGKAVEIMLELAGAGMEDLREFAALGAAFAVVHDQPFPEDWPHHQVAPKAVPTGDLEAAVRFADLVAAQREGQLLHDPRRLRVEELKFVVDTRVELAELKWARREGKWTLSKLGRAYDAVRYDHARVRQGAYAWPYAGYGLAEILKRGGICVDQAYFAAMVGKARGVPTLFFSGQGADGGHAWFGYMERPGRWEMDVGRYESQNYPVGEALDPQLWQPINDGALDLLVGDMPRHASYAAARAAVGWAGLARDIQERGRRLREARGILPELPDVWFMEEQWLVKSGADEAERLRFYEAWVVQFSRQADFKVHAQNAILEIYRKRGDEAKVAEMQREILRENRRKRFDLGIWAGVDKIFTHLEAENWKEAEREFRSVVRRFDEKGGGSLFYQLIRPYVLTCAEVGQWKLAEDALKYAEKRMPVEPGSILSEEFERLKLMVGRRLKPGPRDG